MTGVRAVARRGAQPAADLEAVDVGQVDVEHDQVEADRRPAAAHPARCAASSTVKPSPREDAGGRVARRPRCRRRPGSTAEGRVAIVVIRSPPGRRGVRGAGRGDRQLQRDRHRERRALSERALDRDVAAEQDAPACWLSDRPRPVPRSRFWIGESTWTKSWNSARRCSAAMPMPVSVTAKVTRSPSTSVRRDAHLAVGRELQRVRDEVAQDLRQLLVVRVDAAGRPRGSSKISDTVVGSAGSA